MKTNVPAVLKLFSMVVLGVLAFSGVATASPPGWPDCPFHHNNCDPFSEYIPTPCLGLSDPFCQDRDPVTGCPLLPLIVHEIKDHCVQLCGAVCLNAGYGSSPTCLGPCTAQCIQTEATENIPPRAFPLPPGTTGQGCASETIFTLATRAEAKKQAQPFIDMA